MAFKKVTYSESARIATVEPIRSKRDIRRIQNWFIEHNLEKYALLFKFGVYTGLRASDILMFKTKDLYNKKVVTIREVKTGKVKEFPLKVELQKAINSYIEKKNLNEEDYVFAGRGDRELDRSQVYRFLNKACDALGIEANVGTHTLRKTFGYHHYKQFNDIVTLQKIFNHTSPDVTLRYVGITQDEIDKTYLDLDLENDTELELEQIALKGKNRTRIKAVLDFVRHYLKYTQNRGKHKEFAEIILDLIVNTNEYKY